MTLNNENALVLNRGKGLAGREVRVMEYVTLCKDHAEDRMLKGGKLVFVVA